LHLKRLIINKKESFTHAGKGFSNLLEKGEYVISVARFVD